MRENIGNTTDASNEQTCEDDKGERVPVPAAGS